jgi:hypothetical protein
MVSYTFTPEQSALLAAANTAWERRGRAKRQGMPFGEESLTETILSDLLDAFPGPLRIVPFGKYREGKTGADWAWVFRDANGTRNLPMLVQAKALDLVDHEYTELDRFIGKSTERQIDRLIDTASAWGWPAIYAFYNHLSLPARIPNNCRTVPNAGRTLPECWGVSVADAETVRGLLDSGKDRSFDTHRKVSMPLHCLVCSGASGRRSPEGSPGQVQQALRRLRALMRPAGRDAEFMSGEVTPPIFTELPHLFARALEAVRMEALEGDDEVLKGLSEDYPQLAGVVVLQDDEDSFLRRD